MDSLTEKARAFADTVRKALEPLTKISLEPLKKSLAGLWSALKPFAKNVGQGLVWLYKEALVPLAKWTIEKALPAFIDVLAGAIRVLNSVINAFKPVGAWLWENFLKPVAAWTGGVIVSSLQQLAGALNNLSGWIDGNQETFVKGAGVVAAFIAAFKAAEFVAAIAPMLASLGELIASSGLVSSVLSGISTALGVLSSPVTLIVGLIAGMTIAFVDLYAESEEFRKQVKELGKTWLEALKPVAEFVKNVLTDAWNKILKPVITFFVQTLIPNVISIFKQLWQQVLVPLANFIGTVLQPVFKVLSDVLTMLWQKIIVPLAQAIGEVLAEAWQGFYDILTITVLPIVRKVIDYMTELWKRVIIPIIDVLWKNLKPAFENVFDSIGTVIEGVKKVFTGLIKFVTGVFTGQWDKAWNGVKDIFSGVFTSLYGLVKTPLNMIIDAINKVIDGLNSISVSIPEVEIFGQKVGGGSIGLPRIPKIPRLAKGGLAFGPTMAMVGDNKGASIDPEVVAPLSKLQGILDNSSSAGNREMVGLLGQILTAIRSSKGDLILQVGSTEIGRVAATGINDIQRRTGVSPLRT
jgi:phage-related protein